MNNVVKFKWEGTVEDESGLATYEIGTSSYSVRFPALRSANLAHMAMSEAYQQGYEEGIRKAKFEVQAALSKISA
jgi:hypothetical protein